MSESNAAAASAAPASAPTATSDQSPNVGVPVDQPGGEPQKEAAKNDEPKFKVKVGGKEMEVPVSELVKRYQIEHAGEERMRKAAEVEKRGAETQKKLDGLVSAAKAGDYEGLRAAGLSEEDIEGLSVKFLSARQQKMLEEERVKALSPDQRELEELRGKQKEREIQAEQEKKDAYEKQVQTAHQALSNAVTQTVAALPEALRGDEFVVARVVDAWGYLIENEEALRRQGVDLQKLTPKSVADTVRANLRAVAKRYATVAADDELDDLLEPAVRERVAKKHAAAAQASAHPALTATPQVRAPGSNEPPKDPRKTRGQLLRFAGPRST